MLKLTDYKGLVWNGSTFQIVQRPGYGLNDQGSVHGDGADGTFFFSPPLPGRLWGPPCILWNDYQQLFSRG